MLIPIAVAAGTWGITWQQGNIEDQRATAERELAKQRAQDEALQAYLDQMNDLLLKYNLRDSGENSEARTLARARTLTVLGRLNSSRKTQVMQFLTEAKLAQSVDGRDPVLGLSGADLSGASMNGSDLSGADLFAANLNGTSLIAANLNGAHIDLAFLHDADLINATLIEAHLSGADLSSAEMSRDTDFSYADLSGANLSDTQLSYANFSNANLGSAFLENTDVTGAKFSGANLTDVRGLNNDTLEKQARSLEGATMPNGQQYEDWLKSNGSGKDK